MLNEEVLVYFEKLKFALNSGPVLKNPDFMKPLFIQCDASKTPAEFFFKCQIVESNTQ